jgi:serine/threonine protein kinase
LPLRTTIFSTLVSKRILPPRVLYWSAMRPIILSEPPIGYPALPLDIHANEKAIARSDKSLRPLPSQVPAEMAALIGPCLEKDPAKRYQQAGELREALSAVAGGDGVAVGGVALQADTAAGQSLRPRHPPCRSSRES